MASLTKGYGDSEGILTPCSFNITKSVTNVNCFGGSDGTASISIIGSNGPYVIEWFNGASTNAISNLAKGTYFVKVTDNSGCFSNYFVTIEQPIVISHYIITNHVKCNGKPDGSLDLVVSGGVVPYTYVWTPTNENSQDISNLTAQKYKVTITDGNNCTAYDSTTLTEPPLLESSFVKAEVKCNGGSDGEINLTVFGGTPVYDYVWSNGATLEDVYDLPAGMYTVNITDDNNCLLVNDIEITEPLPITTSFVVTDVECYGGTDGSIDMTVNGGVVPYSFIWSTPEIVLGDITEDLMNVPKNTYYIQVTDKNNCYRIDSAKINQAVLLITNIDATYVTCFDSSNGAADLTVTGGVLPYSYLWNNGATSEDITNIKAGIYSVTIADMKGCTGVASIDIVQPKDLNLGFDIKEVSCKDNKDGSVTLYASGATAPYQYLWSNGSDAKDISNLVGSNYTVSILDQQNCPYSATVFVPTNLRDCIDLISIASGFSPNGDGINDDWIIRNSELYSNLDIKVVNRWGEVVFSAAGGYVIPWDGKHKGVDLGSTTYYYVINLGNGDAPFAGSVTIVR